jgi:hypothetical protein
MSSIISPALPRIHATFFDCSNPAHCADITFTMWHGVMKGATWMPIPKRSLNIVSNQSVSDSEDDDRKSSTVSGDDGLSAKDEMPSLRLARNA